MTNVAHSSASNACRPRRAAGALDRRPPDTTALQRAPADQGMPPHPLGHLPILARQTHWSALVDRRTGTIVGYARADGL
jgi:hypothetical protein